MAAANGGGGGGIDDNGGIGPLTVGGVSLEGRIGGFKPKGHRKGSNNGGFPRGGGGGGGGGFPRPKKNNNTNKSNIKKQKSIVRKPLIDSKEITHILHATSIQRKKQECNREIAKLEAQYVDIQVS